MVEKENGDLEGTFIQMDNVVNAFGWHNKNDEDWAVHSKIRNTLDFWHNMIYVEGAELHDMPENKEEALNKIEDLYRRP